MFLLLDVLLGLLDIDVVMVCCWMMVDDCCVCVDVVC